MHANPTVRYSSFSLKRNGKTRLLYMFIAYFTKFKLFHFSTINEMSGEKTIFCFSVKEIVNVHLISILFSSCLLHIFSSLILIKRSYSHSCYHLLHLLYYTIQFSTIAFKKKSVYYPVVDV